MQIASKSLLIAGVGLTVFSFGCQQSQPSPAAPAQSAGIATAADQANAPLLPDPKMTPGATLPVTRADLCVPGYTKKVRNVPVDVKRQVYAEYGITSHKPGDYEVDHLISLELGGSNSIKNLWPESYKTQPWNAHVKDALENELHAEVCSGQMDLAAAQQEIATDWIAAYKKHFHTDRPLAAGGSRRQSGRSQEGRQPHPLTDAGAPPFLQAPSPSPASPGTQVWVNTKSGKYFSAGSPYYGHTKQGQYMSEADAIKQGYMAAKGQ